MQILPAARVMLSVHFSGPPSVHDVIYCTGPSTESRAPHRSDAWNRSDFSLFGHEDRSQASCSTSHRGEEGKRSLILSLSLSLSVSLSMSGVTESPSWFFSRLKGTGKNSPYACKRVCII